MASTQAARWSWRNEPELMARLRDIQDTEKFMHRDITTIVGLFTSQAELLRHVAWYEERASSQAGA